MLVVVAAEPWELRGILRHCGGVHKLDWPLWFARGGELNGQPAVLLANGPGFRLAAEAVQAALERVRPDAAVSTGFCGALEPALAPGEVFVATEVVSGGERYQARLPRTGCSFRSGRLASLDRVVASVVEKRGLHEEGLEAVDMESAAVARVACRAGLPFYAVRAVLDGAEEGFELDFNRMRGADGRFSRTRILAAVLRRPLRRAPELCRLARRGRMAARALGEFFGDCQF